MKMQKLAVFAPDLTVSGKVVARDQAFAVDTETGLIVKVGSVADVGGWVMAQRRYHAASVASERFGGFVFPGLTDAHEHPVLYASLEMMGAVSVWDCKTSAEIVQKLKVGSRGSRGLIATGWNTSVVRDLAGAHLDEAFPDSDVVVYDASFHGAMVSSSLGRKIAERMKANPNAAGHLDNGGRAVEDFGLAGLEIIEDSYPERMLRRAVEQQLDKYASQGITSVHDLCMRTPKQILALLSLRKRWNEERGTEFPVTRIFLRPEQIEWVAERLPEFERDGLLTGDDFHKIAGMKLFADGSLGSYTARLREPYLGGILYGECFDSPTYIHEALQVAARNGLATVAMHAIGDRGVDRALETAEAWKTVASGHQLEPVFRVEHFELPLPLEETLVWAKELGVYVCPQANFLLDAPYRDRLGDRVDSVSPHRAILDARIPMMGGTDGMPDSVLYNLYLGTHAVNDCQRMELHEAVWSLSGAVARFEGDNRGTIAEGKKADFVVAYEDLFSELTTGAVDNVWRPEVIQRLESKIVHVVKNGRVVYDRPVHEGPLG